MIKDILKLGGVKTEDEFYAKYPTEEDFLRAHPEAINILKGGGQPTMDQFFNYGTPTANTDLSMQYGGAPTAKQFFNYGPKTPNLPIGTAEDGGTIPMNTKDSFLPEKANKFKGKLMENVYKSKLKEFMTQISGMPIAQSGYEIPFGTNPDVMGDIARRRGLNQQMQTDQSGFVQLAPMLPPGQIPVNNGEYNFMDDVDAYNAQKTQSVPGVNDTSPVDAIMGKQRKGSFLDGMSGLNKAETILNVSGYINSEREKYIRRKEEEKLEADLYNPMNRYSGYPTDRGKNETNTFEFDPYNMVPTQFTGMQQGGPVSAKNGLNMNPGLGNSNQFTWSSIGGMYSEPNVEVRKTLEGVEPHEANVEAERGETVVTNLNGDGIPEQYKVGGDKHYDGGTPLNLPDNSFVFSKFLKLKDKELMKEFGVTKKNKKSIAFADLAKKYDINEDKKVLMDKNTDALARSTAELNIANANKMLGKLSLIQESQKGFPTGVPMIAMPYLEMMGMNPDEFNNFSAQGTPEVPNPNMQTGGESTRDARARRFAEVDPYYQHSIAQAIKTPFEWIDAGLEAAAEYLPRILKYPLWADNDYIVYGLGLTKQIAKINNKYIQGQPLTPEEQRIFDIHRAGPTKSIAKSSSTPGIGTIARSSSDVNNTENPNWAPPYNESTGSVIQDTIKVNADKAKPKVTPKTIARPPALTDEQMAKQAYGTDWDSLSTEEKTHILQNRMFQSGGATIFNLQYPQIAGQNIQGPTWKPPLQRINQQLPGQAKDRYYVTPTGIIWPKSQKSSEPSMDWFKTYPGASDALWNEYGGFDKWQKDLAAAKGQESDASRFWVDKIVNPYTQQLSGKPYVNTQTKGAYVPGTQWSTPYYGSPAQAPADPEMVGAPGAVPTMNTQWSRQPAPETPFWTPDVINVGAAYRNMGEIHKYLPWEAKTPFYAADPTFISPDRALGSINANTNAGASGAANLGDAQSFNARMSAMQGNDAVANTMADTYKTNIGTANQFELANKSAYNQYMQEQGNRATRLHDKGVIADQQHRNSKTAARDVMRENFTNAWNNRGMTQSINNLYPQYNVDPTTGYVHYDPTREFQVADYTGTPEYEQDMANYMTMVKTGNKEAAAAMGEYMKFKYPRESGSTKQPSAEVLQMLYGMRK